MIEVVELKERISVRKVGKEKWMKCEYQVDATENSDPVRLPRKRGSSKRYRPKER
jgi:hypothetical protein